MTFGFSQDFLCLKFLVVKRLWFVQIVYIRVVFEEYAQRGVAWHGTCDVNWKIFVIGPH